MCLFGKLNLEKRKINLVLESNSSATKILSQEGNVHEIAGKYANGG